MNTYEYIKYYTGKSIRDNYQISNATIKRAHTNSTYDIVTIIGSDDYPLFNISPVDPKVVFSVDDNVTVLIPVGNKQLTRILGYSNIQFPVEEVIEFNEPDEIIGTIYLTCPDEGKIEIYSLDGTLDNTITDLTNNYWICTDGIYLYFSKYNNFYKVKPDGTDLTTIYEDEITVNYLYGLAVNGDYLYTANSSCITRVKISDGDFDNTWKEITEGVSFEYTIDLCGTDEYLFITGIIFDYESYMYYTAIKIYDYSGNFVREIVLDSNINFEIAADSTKIYMNSAEEIRVYTLQGIFEFTISVTYLKSVTIHDGYIYAVNPTKVQKYNSSGVFIDEFGISFDSDVEDCIII